MLQLFLQVEERALQKIREEKDGGLSVTLEGVSVTEAERLRGSLALNEDDEVGGAIVWSNHVNPQ